MHRWLLRYDFFIVFFKIWASRLLTSVDITEILLVSIKNCCSFNPNIEIFILLSVCILTCTLSCVRFAHVTGQAIMLHRTIWRSASVTTDGLIIQIGKTRIPYLITCSIIHSNSHNCYHPSAVAGLSILPNSLLARL